MRASPGAILGPARKALPYALLTFLVVLVLQWRHFDSAQYTSKFNTFKHNVLGGDAKCPLDAEYLLGEQYGLKGDVVFHKQCVRATDKKPINRDEVANVSQSLFGHRQDLNLDSDCYSWDAMPCEPIDVAVPSPYPIRKYPEFIFGLATSFDRLVDSVPQLSHWLRDSGVRLVAMLTDAHEREQELDRLTAFYEENGVELVIIKPRDKSLHVNVQHFVVLQDLVEFSTPETKWVGLIDDDTFFPSLYPLGEALGTLNHTIPTYLGALSDNMAALQFFGVMAYGGAGAFLSMPLARELEPHVDTCIRETRAPQGDALLKNCIYSQTSTRLTILNGLQQMDMTGDVSGFYESGTLPLSLHHWKTWHQTPVDHLAKAADFCGDCLLQRWRFGDDTVLVNGYSASEYSDGLGAIDLSKTEGTMNSPENYDWSHGPMREKVDPSKKKTYYLVDASVVGSQLRQVYIHRGQGEGVKDEVLELWWQWNGKPKTG